MTKALSLAGAMLALAGVSFAADPIRVMLLDGESGGAYHKWKLTTPVLQKQLEETGLFQVDVVTAPPAGGDFSAFKPDFSKYAVVVWNYDAPDERWPAELKASFENYVRRRRLRQRACRRQRVSQLGRVQRNDRRGRLARSNYCRSRSHSSSSLRSSQSSVYDLGLPQLVRLTAVSQTLLPCRR